MRLNADAYCIRETLRRPDGFGGGSSAGKGGREKGPECSSGLQGTSCLPLPGAGRFSLEYLRPLFPFTKPGRSTSPSGDHRGYKAQTSLQLRGIFSPQPSSVEGLFRLRVQRELQVASSKRTGTIVKNKIRKERSETIERKAGGKSI